MGRHVDESTSQTLNNKTLGSDLDAGGFKITNLAAPVNDNDAARKIDVSAAGKWQVVYETTLSANMTYVDITGLNINTDKIYKLYLNLKNVAGTTAECNIFINGNYTATEYYKQYMEINGTGITAGRANDSNIGTIPSGGAFASEVSIYKDITNYLRVISYSNYSNGSNIRGLSTWNTTINTITNITSIRISSNTSNAFSAGSYILLCKPRG